MSQHFQITKQLKRVEDFNTFLVKTTNDTICIPKTKNISYKPKLSPELSKYIDLV